MNARLAVFFLVFLGISAPAAGSDDAVTTLKADLSAVVKLGKVKPVDGLTTAGQPNAEAFGVFAANGYRVVIDLRTKKENRGLDEPAVVSALGMEYVSMPVDYDDITYEKARELGDLLDRYDEPVLLHCASANRIGALLALDTFAETGDAELALERGRAAGLKGLEKTVRKLLRTH